MVETLMASHVRSPLFSWGRPSTPAPQMDAQMGSSGALQPQTMRETNSTPFVLRKMVSLRKRDINLGVTISLVLPKYSIVTQLLFLFGDELSYLNR